jgi:hypothetical protein
VFARVGDDVLNAHVHGLERAFHDAHDEFGVLVNGKGAHQANRVVDTEARSSCAGLVLVQKLQLRR